MERRHPHGCSVVHSGWGPQAAQQGVIDKKRAVWMWE